jgi:DNA replication ATP-dependent helicase Dna2
VHILGECSSSTILLNFSTPHLLILHPDILISSTSISAAVSCVRKPILQARLRTTCPPSQAVHFGNVLHELFQICLQQSKWDEAFIRDAAERVIRRGVAKWWSIGMELDEALAQTLERSKAFMSFADKFVRSSPIVRY